MKNKFVFYIFCFFYTYSISLYAKKKQSSFKIKICHQYNIHTFSICCLSLAVAPTSFLQLFALMLCFRRVVYFAVRYLPLLLCFAFSSDSLLRFFALPSPFFRIGIGSAKAEAEASSPPKPKRMKWRKSKQLVCKAKRSDEVKNTCVLRSWSEWRSEEVAVWSAKLKNAKEAKEKPSKAQRKQIWRNKRLIFFIFILSPP